MTGRDFFDVALDFGFAGAESGVLTHYLFTPRTVSFAIFGDSKFEHSFGNWLNSNKGT
jgi:hypothetical protein